METVYISKGIKNAVRPDGSYELLCRSGRQMLSSDQATVWDAAQAQPAGAGTSETLDELIRLGLAERVNHEHLPLDSFRLLMRCILEPMDRAIIPIDRAERSMLKWIRNVAMIPTIAELVRLAELNIRPGEQYMGKDNLQHLIETIYRKKYGQYFDQSTLPLEMVMSDAFHETMSTVLRLLRKGYIFLI